LTEDQKTELIGVMYEVSQKVYADIGHDPTSRLDFPSDMDPETISEKMEITNRVLTDAADSSRDILSESQLKAYRDYLRTYSEEVEMSLIMMGRRE
jgi:ribosomal protein S13